MSILKYCADTFLPPPLGAYPFQVPHLSAQRVLLQTMLHRQWNRLYRHIMITIYGQSYDFHLLQFNVHRSTMHYLSLATCIHLFMLFVTVHVKSCNGHVGPNTLALKFVS
jgi:hypothetical protein